MAEKKLLLTGFLTCLAGTSLAKPKNAVMTAKCKKRAFLLKINEIL